MFSQLIGQELELKQCRHDGDAECCFETTGNKAAKETTVSKSRGSGQSYSSLNGSGR